MSLVKNGDAAPPVEMMIVQSKRVKCDGGDAGLGHPRVFMDMGEDTSVECKYCGKRFVLDPDADPSAH